MKTDFLKSLGIDDQSVINQIMAENGKDIAREQGKAENLQKKIDTLTSDLETNNGKLKELEKLEGSDNTISQLNARIAELETEATNAKAKYDSDIKGVKKGFLTDEFLRDKGAKSVKMARALIDMDKIDIGEDGKLTGLEEQLTALAETNDYKLAFGTDTGMRGFTPSHGGGDPNTPTTPKTLSEIIKTQLTK